MKTLLKTLILNSLIILVLSNIASAHSPLPLFGLRFNGNALLLLPTSSKSFFESNTFKMNGITGSEFLIKRQETPELKTLITNINKIGNGWSCSNKITKLLEERQNDILRMPLESNELGPVVLFEEELSEEAIKCFCP